MPNPGACHAMNGPDASRPASVRRSRDSQGFCDTAACLRIRKACGKRSFQGKIRRSWVAIASSTEEILDDLGRLTGNGPATWARYGHVAYVRETVQRTDGNHAGGAVAGALIGAFLGGRGPAALFGAAGGAAVGASVSQGHSETRRYDVVVQFDDGTMQTFSYGGYSPFNPGEVVVQTPRGSFHG